LRHTSAAIKEIYAELRRMLGSSVSAKELLNFSFIATNFFNKQSDDEIDFYGFDSGEKNNHLSKNKIFEEWPIDIAMGGGGWRILEYEYHKTRDEFMDYGMAVVNTDFFSLSVFCGNIRR
jgi:hypothetical protein